MAVNSGRCKNWRGNQYTPTFCTIVFYLWQWRLLGGTIYSIPNIPTKKGRILDLSIDPSKSNELGININIDCIDSVEFLGKVLGPVSEHSTHEAATIYHFYSDKSTTKMKWLNRQLVVQSGQKLISRTMQSTHWSSRAFWEHRNDCHTWFQLNH